MYKKKKKNSRFGSIDRPEFIIINNLRFKKKKKNAAGKWCIKKCISFVLIVRRLYRKRLFVLKYRPSTHVLLFPMRILYSLFCERLSRLTPIIHVFNPHYFNNSTRREYCTHFNFFVFFFFIFRYSARHELQKRRSTGTFWKRIFF